jgi:hypothetical protein
MPLDSTVAWLCKMLNALDDFIVVWVFMAWTLWLQLLRKGIAIAVVLVLVLAAAFMQGTLAEESLQFNPTQGPPGTVVTVVGSGFVTDAPLTINFGTTSIGTTYANSGVVNATFTVPQTSPGSYIVTVMDLASYSLWHNAGLSEAGTFIVTSGSTATQTPMPTTVLSPTIEPSTGGSTSYYPINPNPATIQPSKTAANSFWSPLTIMIVAVIVLSAVIIPTYLVTRRSSDNRRRRFEEQQPSYHPHEPISPYQPNSPPPGNYNQTFHNPPTRIGSQNSSLAASRYSRTQSYSNYNRPSSTSYTSNHYTQPRYNQTPKYQPKSYKQPEKRPSKPCPHCGRAVRADQNVCPNCNKRLV